MQIDSLLDVRPMSNIQRRVLLLVGCGILLEGFDIQVLGMCAPAIMADWHMTKQSLGPAMASALVGMTAGATVGGYLGDRFGRRPLLISCMALFAFCTLATAAARSIGDVVVLRLLAGVAFGTVLTNAAALVAEWFVPARGLKAVGLVIVGVPAGGMLGAALCSWLIPFGGWRSAFFVAGALPLIVALAMAVWLPESIRYVARMGDLEKLGKLLLAIDPASTVRSDSVRSGDPTPARDAMREVWQAGLRRRTLGLAAAFLTNLAVSYALFNWVPVLLTTLDFSSGVAVRGVFMLNLFGTVAAAIGLLVAKSDSGKKFVLVYLGIGIAAVVGLATLLNSAAFVQGAAGIRAEGPQMWLFLAGLSLIGAGTNGSQTGLYGLAASAYPTRCRSSGIGAAAAFGRAGGIFSSLLGGSLLGLPHGPMLFLSSIGILFVLSGAAVLSVGRLGQSGDAWSRTPTS